MQRGPLVVDLAEDGEIKPSEQLILKSEVEGRHSILFIIPEGAMVQKGDLLVELDVATTVDEKVNQEIAVTNAASALEMKREDLEIARNQAASDVELAEQELAFAREDLAFAPVLPRSSTTAPTSPAPAGPAKARMCRV